MFVNAEESGIDSDGVLMEAAGYLEGALTHELVMVVRGVRCGV